MGQLFSQLGIVNKALYAVGGARLGSLSNSNDPNTVTILDVYDQCRQEVLSEHPWSFAIQTVTLETLALATPLPNMNDGVSYAYGLPPDFLEIYLLSQPCQYRIEMLKTPFVTQPILALISDVNDLSGMKYTFDNQDPTTYGSKFYDALALNIAKTICTKVSKVAGLQEKLEMRYQKALLSAISWDSNSSSPDQPQADEWFIARLAGSGVVSGLPNGNIGFFPDPYNPDF